MQNRQGSASGYPMWFNPEAGVIYLGPKTCLGESIALLKLGLPIHRIAFDAEATYGGNYGYLSCCDTASANAACLQPVLGYQADFLGRCLRVLHRFTIARSVKRVSPSCPSLKEVLLFHERPW